MKKVILSPFYTITSNELLYLDKYKITNLPLNEGIKKQILRDEGVLFNEIDRIDKKDTILVLEPHPDDFALSALGYSLNRYNAIILNIFSKMNLDSFTWKDNISISQKEYEKLRLDESKLVIKKILKQKFLSLKEKSMRITNKDANYVTQKITNNVDKIISTTNTIDTILVPMGIGEHPDHMIVYDAIIEKYSIDKHIKVILYPEYPYARCKKDYNNRTKQINKKYKIKPIVVNIEPNIDILADAISAYKSQFDDINRNQMLAIIREDTRAITKEYNKDSLSLVYYEIERKEK